MYLRAGPKTCRAAAFRDLTPGFERDVVVRRPTFWTTEIFLRRDGKLVKIDKPDNATASFHREWLLLQLRSDWTIEGHTYPAGALIATHLDAFLEGRRAFDVLFEPAERKSLVGFSPTRHHMIVTELDNVRSRISVLTLSRSKVASRLTARRARVWRGERERGRRRRVRRLLLERHRLPDADDPGTRNGRRKVPRPCSSSSLPSLTRLVWPYRNMKRISKDGTRVPYFEVAPKSLVHDGTNPTLIYGYGGFEISMLPSYRPAVGAAWLEKGGVYVVANIRGGGEFGPRWHQSALKANRYKAYDDFIAVALDLIERKVTSPLHLGAQGGSNGGLLMGNMLVRRPDLFRAIVCQVPLLDMRRYHRLLAGASWMAEYGNPDLPEEWAFIRGFSPYHNVEKSAEVPAHALHHVDQRRPCPSRPRTKNGRQDEGPGARRSLLREHRRWSCRCRRQQAGGVHASFGLYVFVE